EGDPGHRLVVQGDLEPVALHRVDDRRMRRAPAEVPGGAHAEPLLDRRHPQCRSRMLIDVVPEDQGGLALAGTALLHPILEGDDPVPALQGRAQEALVLAPPGAREGPREPRPDAGRAGVPALERRVHQTEASTARRYSPARRSASRSQLSSPAASRAASLNALFRVGSSISSSFSATSSASPGSASRPIRWSLIRALIAGRSLPSTGRPAATYSKTLLGRLMR